MGDFLGHEVFHLLAVAVGMKKQFEKCQKRLHDVCTYIFLDTKYPAPKERRDTDELI